MNFSLTLTPDEAYYKEAYGEMISALKWKKYEPIFATIMILFGLGLHLLDKTDRLGIFPFVFSAIGAYEFYKVYYEKKKWIKDRLDSRIVGKSIELAFTDDVIKQSGPFTNGELKWDGLKNIVKTQKGILIKPENGISIYLPNTVFSDPAHIDFILAKQRFL